MIDLTLHVYETDIIGEAKLKNIILAELSNERQ